MLRERPCNLMINNKPHMCAVQSALTFLISRGSIYKVPEHWASIYPSHESLH